MESNMLTFISQSLKNDPTFELILNWREISKMPLTIDFIRDYHKLLAWDVMCQHQPFDLKTVEEFERYINFEILAKNPNISSEVLLSKLDKMDWESLQTHQKFNNKMIKLLKNTIDPVIVLKCQKLDEESIMTLLEPFIVGEKWVLLRGLLDIIFANQKVSVTFINEFIQMSPPMLLQVSSDSKSEITQKSNTPLVNLALVAQHQELTELFIRSFIYDKHHHETVMNNPSLLNVFSQVCLHQKLSNEFIHEYIEDVKPLAMELLINQQMNETTIVSKFVPLMKQNFLLLGAFVEKQQFTKQFLDNFLKNLELSEKEFKELKQNLTQTVFLRCIEDNKSTTHLNWTFDEVEELSKEIDWITIASKKLTPSQLSALITKYPSLLPWYILIKNNKLTESMLLDAYEAKQIGAIEWWLALSTYQYSESFAETHKNKKLWWEYIPESNRKKFFEDCLNVLEVGPEYDNDPSLENERTARKNLRTFLHDFVEKADWKLILATKQLDEWFIRIFSHFAFKIDMFWWKISRYQKLTEPFIKKYLNKMDLSIVLGYQVLSQEYIEELTPFCNDDCWDKIWKFQKVDDEFRKKYLNTSQ